LSGTGKTGWTISDEDEPLLIFNNGRGNHYWSLTMEEGTVIGLYQWRREPLLVFNNGGGNCYWSLTMEEGTAIGL